MELSVPERTGVVTPSRQDGTWHEKCRQCCKQPTSTALSQHTCRGYKQIHYFFSYGAGENKKKPIRFWRSPFWASAPVCPKMGSCNIPWLIIIFIIEIWPLVYLPKKVTSCKLWCNIAFSWWPYPTAENHRRPCNKASGGPKKETASPFGGFLSHRGTPSHHPRWDFPR